MLNPSTLYRNVYNLIYIYTKAYLCSVLTRCKLRIRLSYRAAIGFCSFGYRISYVSITDKPRRWTVRRIIISTAVVIPFIPDPVYVDNAKRLLAILTKLLPSNGVAYLLHVRGSRRGTNNNNNNCREGAGEK